jgi:hypothetical protein
MLNVLLSVVVCTISFLLVMTYVYSTKNDADSHEHWGFLSGVCYSTIVGLCIAYPVAMEVFGALVLSLVAIPTFYILTSTFR